MNDPSIPLAKPTRIRVNEFTREVVSLFIDNHPRVRLNLSLADLLHCIEFGISPFELGPVESDEFHFVLLYYSGENICDFFLFKLNSRHDTRHLDDTRVVYATFMRAKLGQLMLLLNDVHSHLVVEE